MSDTRELQGTKILVTGSSSGIGLAITRRLLAAGVRVIGVARHHDALKDDMQEGYVGIGLDLSDLDAATAALESLARTHDDVDAVLSNAGGGRIAELEQVSAAQIRHDIDLNLTSHLLVARAFLPGLKRRGGGDLLVTGSVSGQRGRRKGSVYSAAKFGLRGMTQALREECARAGVRVTLISPGPVDTPFFDDLDYRPDAANGSALGADDVAAVMQHVLQSPRHVVFDEITLSARHHSMRRR